MSANHNVQTRRERRLAERTSRRAAPRRSEATGSRIGIGVLTLVALIGGLIVVAVAIALGGAPAKSSTGSSSVGIVHAPAGIPAEGNVLGRADAPVTIDLYEDFQCPACESWSQTVFPHLATGELARGTVKLVFHNLAFLGPESEAAAHAAYAAGQQGHFWDMWATLYGNQGRENGGSFSRDRLIEMGSGLGLDVARFTTDMDSAAAVSALSTSTASANAASITSTPTLVIAGQAYAGVKPYANLATIVAAAAAGR